MFETHKKNESNNREQKPPKKVLEILKNNKGNLSNDQLKEVIYALVDLTSEKGSYDAARQIFKQLDVYKKSEGEYKMEQKHFLNQLLTIARDEGGVDNSYIESLMRV